MQKPQYLHQIIKIYIQKKTVNLIAQKIKFQLKIKIKKLIIPPKNYLIKNLQKICLLYLEKR
jgi:hypothetical protein